MDFKIEKSSDHKGLCENYFCLKLAYNPCLEAISAFKAGHHSAPVFGFKEHSYPMSLTVGMFQRTGRLTLTQTLTSSG